MIVVPESLTMTARTCLTASEKDALVAAAKRDGVTQAAWLRLAVQMRLGLPS